MSPETMKAMVDLQKIVKAQLGLMWTDLALFQEVSCTLQLRNPDFAEHQRQSLIERGKHAGDLLEKLDQLLRTFPDNQLS